MKGCVTDWRNADNTTAQSDPQLGSPNLWMFVYDPDMSVGDAYTSSSSSMRLFNAHGTSTVLLDNHYFEARDGTARYEYGKPYTYIFLKQVKDHDDES